MDKRKDISPVTGAREPARSRSSDVDQFLAEVRQTAPTAQARGRMVFALDATMSRQPSWDLACEMQADMFDAAGSIGGLAVQLVYFRGIGECRASSFVANARALRDLMVKIDCRGGHTQIAKVLSHVRRQAERQPIAALAFVGDAMEENPDHLAELAAQLGLLGVRAFMFHEGRDPGVERVFREIAKLTKGAYLPFDQSSAGELRTLLQAVARYAAGGFKALEASKDRGTTLLLSQMKP